MRRTSWMATIAVMTLATGCAVNHAAVVTPRAALDLPGRFEPIDATARTWPSDTLVGSGCLTTLKDPRDDSEIHAARAGGGMADFRIQDGRYGVRPGELLRVVCNTGQPVGVVGWR